LRWANSLEVFEIDGGDRGAYQTVDAMLDKIHEWGSHPDVRRQAVSIVKEAHVNEMDRRGEIRAIFEWSQANIRVVDEHVETIQAPLATIEIGGADCDDFVVLLGSLLASLGHWPQRIKLVAVDPEAPEAFSHVYLEVWDGGEWIALDGIVKDEPLGWKPPNAYREKTMSIGAVRYHPNIRWQTNLSSPDVNAEQQPYRRSPYMPRYLPSAVDDFTANSLAYRHERRLMPPNSKNAMKFSALGQAWRKLGYRWKPVGRWQQIAGLGQTSTGVLQKSTTSTTGSTTPWWGIPVLQTGLSTISSLVVGPQQTELLQAQADLTRAQAEATQAKTGAQAMDLTKLIVPGALIVGGLFVVSRLLK
jgi:hypothetical protein